MEHKINARQYAIFKENHQETKKEAFGASSSGAYGTRLRSLVSPFVGEQP